MDDRELGRGRRDADLVLGPGEMANVQDGTKGNVSVYVGPHKVSLSNTDVPVKWDHEARRFVECNQEDAILPFPSADEGSYIVLNDPAKQDDKKHPTTAGSSSSVDLLTGRTVNIPGPITFPLWPGQHAKVLPGHTLRSNQYLIVRVINDEEARANWGSGVVRKQTSTPSPNETEEEKEARLALEAEQADSGDDSQTGMSQHDLTMGQLIVIKGNDVSFYIPPTGLAAVADDSGNYVRDAITLERLEYCILLDENGEKRYVKGPAVVFPEPTEMFVRGEDGEIKQHAIELNNIQGLHVKVIADYEEDGHEYKAGDELFFKGSEQPIYYPRTEHNTIKYGEEDVHFAVAVPKGEGRYLMDRETGDIATVPGPTMLLPDPREHVIVRRILNDDQVRLWFPGNDDALAVNQEFRRRSLHAGIDFVTERHMERSRADDEDEMRSSRSMGSETGSGTRSVRASEMTRRSSFTPPESISVDNKYDGAVRIEVWPGYAVLVVDKTNKRRVVAGPASTLLDHGETLMPMTLSTGRPKNNRTMIRTPYLRTQNNTVSDIITVETADLFSADLELSYRVNFEGDDKEKWFEVDNYVKILTDHLRSVLKAKVKELDVQTFYSSAANIIRDTILGVAVDGNPRPGKSFSENNMRVYDVEVLEVRMEDHIHKLLSDDRRQAVIDELATQSVERKLEFAKRSEKAERAIVTEEQKTTKARHKSAMEKQGHTFAIDDADLDNELERIARRIKSQIDNETAKLEAEVAQQEQLDAVSGANLERTKASNEQEIARRKAMENIRVEATTTVMEAIDDELVAALQAFGDKQIAAQALEKIGPMAGVGQQVIDILHNALDGVLPGALPDSESKTEH